MKRSAEFRALQRRRRLRPKPGFKARKPRGPRRTAGTPQGLWVAAQRRSRAFGEAAPNA